MCDVLQSKAEWMLHGLPSTEPIPWGLAFCVNVLLLLHFGYAESFHVSFFFFFDKNIFFFYWVESWVPSCFMDAIVQVWIDFFSINMTVCKLKHCYIKTGGKLHIVLSVLIPVNCWVCIEKMHCIETRCVRKYTKIFLERSFTEKK